MIKTILLADDSVTIRKVVELTFMDEDYELISVGGGEEAIEHLRGSDPDLVISDVHMPGVTGYDVCRFAKEKHSDRPVLLLVGTFEPFEEAEAKASGADLHLKKPFDSQELLRTVRDLLAVGAEEPEGAAAEEAVSSEEPPVAVGPEAPAVEEPAQLMARELDAGALSATEPDTASAGAAPEEEIAAGAEVAVATSDVTTSDSATGNASAELSDEAVEQIARRVAQLLGPDVIRDVAWEVVPDLAEVVIKERLRDLESQVD